MLRESAKRQNPSVYVVEVNGFLYTEAERDELGTAATREWLDTLPLSRNKVQAIDECVQGDRLSYYVPLLKYHDNWRKLDLIRNADLAGIIVWEASLDTKNHSFAAQLRDTLLK